MKKSLLLLLTLLLLLSGCGKTAASSETTYSFPEDNLPNVTSNNFYTSFSNRDDLNAVYEYPQENPPYIGWGQEYKGYIYCQDAENEKLYRYKPDGSELKLISEEIEGDFYIIDDWIYYCSIPEDRRKGICINKIQLDGKNHTLIKENIQDFYIYDDWIYFCRFIEDEADGYVSINKSRLDGSDESILEDEASCRFSYQFFNDYIYYVNIAGDTLCRIKPDGTDLFKIKAKDINQFTITENYIYYVSGRYYQDSDVNNGLLYRMNLDGTGLKKLYSGMVDGFAVAEEWIFFNKYDSGEDSSKSQQYYLWKIPVGGGEAIGVLKDISDLSCYYNGRLFYHVFEDQNNNLYSMDISTGESVLFTDDEDTVIEWFRFSGDWCWYLAIDRETGKKLFCKTKLDGSENQQLNVPLMLPIETDYSYYFDTDPYAGNWTFIKTLGEDPAAFGASVIGSGIVIDKKRYIEHTDSCENPVYTFQDSSMDELAKAGVPTAELQADKVVRVKVKSGDYESSFWVLDNSFIILPMNDNKTFCVAEKTSDTPSSLDYIGRIFARYYKDPMMSIVTYYGNWSVRGRWGSGYPSKEYGRDISNAHIMLSQDTYMVGDLKVKNPFYKITPVARSTIREGQGSFAYEMTMGFESPYVVCVMVCASTEDAANDRCLDRFWVINNSEIVFQGKEFYRAVRE